MEGLEKLGVKTFHGPHQAGTVSFLPEGDCEELARRLAGQGIAVRAGLHCAPLAHKSMGTLEKGTVRAVASVFNNRAQVNYFLNVVNKISKV